MKTILAAAGLALLVVSGPAFASADAPVIGQARVLTNPSFTTAGADGAPVFAAPRPDMVVVTGVAPRLAHAAEAYIGQRG